MCMMNVIGIHPTIFFYRRYTDSGSWFTSVRNLSEQKIVFDFFFEVSNQILVEILTDSFNAYAVPKYGLEPIETKKRYKRTLAYTKDALDEYIHKKKIPSNH